MVSIFGPVVVPGDRLYGPLHCMFFQKMESSQHREFVSRAFITMVMYAEVTIVISFVQMCADLLWIRLVKLGILEDSYSVNPFTETHSNNNHQESEQHLVVP